MSWPTGPQAPRPPSRGSAGSSGRTGFTIAAIALGGLVGLVTTVVVFEFRGTSSSAPSLPSSTNPLSPSEPPRSTRPPAPTSSYSPCPIQETSPTVPGWRAIGSAKDRAAFDVPGDFEVRPDRVFGQQSGDRMALAHCAAYFRWGVCDRRTGNRARVGLVTHGSSTNRVGDPVAYARLWVGIGQTDSSTGRTAPVPEPTVTRLRSGSGAEITIATIEGVDSMPDKTCPAASYRVSVAAMELRDGTRALLVVDSDRGTGEDLPLTIEQQIITSLRGL